MGPIRLGTGPETLALYVTSSGIDLSRGSCTNTTRSIQGADWQMPISSIYDDWYH